MHVRLLADHAVVQDKTTSSPQLQHCTTSSDADTKSCNGVAVPLGVAADGGLEAGSTRARLFGVPAGVVMTEKAGLGGWATQDGREGTACPAKYETPHLPLPHAPSSQPHFAKGEDCHTLMQQSCIQWVGLPHAHAFN
eukprot:15466740-Alexandrium_andersonii.AAC.1